MMMPHHEVMVVDEGHNSEPQDLLTASLCIRDAINNAPIEHVTSVAVLCDKACLQNLGDGEVLTNRFKQVSEQYLTKIDLLRAQKLALDL